MNAQEAWLGAYQQLELQLDRATFDTWLRHAELLRIEDGNVFVIGVIQTYARDMLQHRLYKVVERAVHEVFGRPVTLRFELYKPEPVPEVPNTDAPLFRLLQQQPIQETHTLRDRIVRPSQTGLPDTELSPRLTFARFLPGSENSMVYAAAMAVAERPGSGYNPFFVHGGVGIGKTHLLQSIAQACKARGLHAVYVPSEAFTNDLVDSIRNKSTAVFRDRYRSVDVLLLDDIQFIAGKENTQEEIFHTFDALHRFNKQIVIASDRHPRDLQHFEDRLRSRFQGGLVMEVQPPSYETRLAILGMWANDRNVELTGHAIEMIAGRTKMNVRELEGVFNQVAVTHQLSRSHISMDVTAHILDGYRRPRENVTLSRVLEVTARQFGLRINDMTGKSRAGRINTARQVAMYLARDLTSASLHQIGDAFDRTHSTVLHSCHKVIEDMTTDPMLRTAIDQIRAAIVKVDA
ncbi:MAG: chromosomal replication initiator protein DnaA [Chloroflexota bacterium]|nr:chromosomal replication initiator protein DnaA [Chloroflexota bacterium]